MSLFAKDLEVNMEETGPKDGPVLFLIHDFGMDLTVWDNLLPHLPKSLRVIRYDLRGHGGTEVVKPPYAMGRLIRDAEAILTDKGIYDAAVMGIGLGGMIAQGLAVKRLDQVRALILCNTAAKIGHPPHWQAMIDELSDKKEKGRSALAQRLMPLWFHRAAINSKLHLQTQDIFERTDVDGLCGALAALMGTDFYTQTAGLRLSTLGLGGAENRMVPPDMVRETTGLVPASEFKLIRKSGHAMPVDAPEAMGEAVTAFLTDIAHCA